MADGEMSAADVLALLPTGPDMHDLREKANLAKLSDLGEVAFPGLLSIIRTDNSPYVAGRALGVLSSAKNASLDARRKVVSELGMVLYERKSLTGYRNERTLSLMAETIADMGEAGDAMLLLPLLDHPSGDVRSAGYSGMEKLAAKAVFQESPAGDPFGQDNGNASTEREPVPQAKKTYRDYPEWEMLPRVLDYEDEQINARIQKLVDEGEACHEAMLAIVKQCDDWMVATSALAILRETTGDKSRIVAELKPFFSERLCRSEGQDDWLLTSIAQFLADFGKEDDIDALLPMLEHSNKRIRIMGARYLGQRGGQRALEALKQVQGHDANKRVDEEIGKAISAIESRMATQDAEAETHP
jgi:HEAT repeat protein